MWFPKKKSNEIVNMVAELNRELGGLYFTTAYVEKGLYTLNPTVKCVSSRKFNFISFEGGKSYSDMYNYLSGILIGLKASKELKPISFLP